MPRKVIYKDQRLEDAFNKKARLLFDGAMGSLLMQQGLLEDGALSELLCLSNPQAITDIHRRYVQAGADVITTNTFCANRLKLEDKASIEEVYAAAVACSREAGAPYVGADIGPLGVLLEPYGDLEEDEAEEIFAQCVQASAQAGADLIVIETMTGIEEACCAVRAAAQNCSLPIVATMSFTETGRTFLGVSPAQAAEELAACGAGMLGANCSVGPLQMKAVVDQFAAATELPILCQPNAGLPRVENGVTVYDVTRDEFVQAVAQLMEAGASSVGSCCGSTPDYTAGLKALL